MDGGAAWREGRGASLGGGRSSRVGVPTVSYSSVAPRAELVRHVVGAPTQPSLAEGHPHVGH
eukprot:COSAG02_NODE_11413_length_1729_cov_0.899387_1_plen_61_part_10